jgi:hypothetical protein
VRENFASRRSRIVAAVWLAFVIGAYVWGRQLSPRRLHLNDIPPLFAGIRHHPDVVRILPAAVVAVVAIVVIGRLAATMSWRRLLGVAWVLNAMWALSLAVYDGVSRIGEPLTTRYQYLRGLPPIGRSLGSLHSYLRHFTTQLPHYPTEVKGHGPLAVLPFWLLARIGLPQPSVAAALVIALGTSSVVAVAVTLRVIVDEAAARRALPFLVMMPAVLWIATSGDAMFLGVSAWAVALLALATRHEGRASFQLALAAGLLSGATLYMTYGLLVFATLPLAVVVLRRRIELAVPVVLGVAAVALAFTFEGFSYIAGFEATRRAWEAGIGPVRSRPYFIVGDVADLCLSAGPILAIGLANLRSRRLAVLVGAVIISVIASDVSGFVRGEAERIWLPFVPWLVAAAADIPLTRRGVTTLLASQAVVGIAIELFTKSPW